MRGKIKRDGKSSKRFFFPKNLHFAALLIIIVSALITSVYFLTLYYQNTPLLTSRIINLAAENKGVENYLKRVELELNDLKSQDQLIRNDRLEEEINNIEKTYNKAVSTYEKLLQLKDMTKKTDNQDKLFAQSLKFLAERKYASADASLSLLDKQIEEDREKIASSFTIPENVMAVNTPPSSGYRRQKVETDIGAFLVDIVTADLNSTRVIVDTASDSDCHNNCPVLPLSTYVSRNGAFAGINGSYFCPASYPSCAGKSNAFDTLLMNKNKVYFNSDNNVYSNVPAVIFSGNSARFVGRSLEWGRDTSVDAVIANQPLLVLNGQNIFGGDAEPKRASRGSRSFIGTTGSTVYIGVVHATTAAQMAKVLQTMGIQNVLNLDSGGSTALWFGGYKAGPGRAIPNAILFLSR